MNKDLNYKQFTEMMLPYEPKFISDELIALHCTREAFTLINTPIQNSYVIVDDKQYDVQFLAFTVKGEPSEEHTIKFLKAINKIVANGDLSIGTLYKPCLMKLYSMIVSFTPTYLLVFYAISTSNFATLKEKYADIFVEEGDKITSDIETAVV